MILIIVYLAEKWTEEKHTNGTGVVEPEPKLLITVPTPQNYFGSTPFMKFSFNA